MVYILGEPPLAWEWQGQIFFKGIRTTPTTGTTLPYRLQYIRYSTMPAPVWWECGYCPDEYMSIANNPSCIKCGRPRDKHALYYPDKKASHAQPSQQQGAATGEASDSLSGRKWYFQCGYCRDHGLQLYREHVRCAKCNHKPCREQHCGWAHY